MKNLLTCKLLLLTLFSVSTAALAHPGHLPEEAAHGLLHVEHIIMIAVVGLTVYIVNILRKK